MHCQTRLRQQSAARRVQACFDMDCCASAHGRLTAHVRACLRACVRAVVNRAVPQPLLRAAHSIVDVARWMLYRCLLHRCCMLHYSCYHWRHERAAESSSRFIHLRHSSKSLRVLPLPTYHTKPYPTRAPCMPCAGAHPAARRRRMPSAKLAARRAAPHGRVRAARCRSHARTEPLPLLLGGTE